MIEFKVFRSLQRVCPSLKFPLISDKYQTSHSTPQKKKNPKFSRSFYGSKASYFKSTKTIFCCCFNDSVLLLLYYSVNGNSADNLNLKVLNPERIFSL